ncbi:hypothetical protein COT79_00255 [Candidatus Berkelbacteria bacterium CG10_big_fil_rev_8_21_14_0_10_43_14]|uniref:Uncharacterized protein n=1 Tax=Candidatus Berkelbacteria bacterium CG10_big_fil_rev_8_21_14_0_10_43_14 TaxID=1974515 RepID=A0A2M6R9E2_9BACT|nr:MAG: hypothetical protein COT79_00255 [Candidatus Berkelbacteria bacterium CG10_big_fil_rev_8_21_14_0_10_43_14]
MKNRSKFENTVAFIVVAGAKAVSSAVIWVFTTLVFDLFLCVVGLWSMGVGLLKGMQEGSRYFQLVWASSVVPVFKLKCGLDFGKKVIRGSIILIVGLAVAGWYFRKPLADWVDAVCSYRITFVRKPHTVTNLTERVMRTEGKKWVAHNYLPSRTQCQTADELEKIIRPYDGYFGWIARTVDWDINVVRALALIESGCTPDAVDGSFLTGQSSVAHVGMFQLSAGVFAQFLPQQFNGKLRALELAQSRSIRANHNGRISDSEYIASLRAFKKTDPRCALALNALAGCNLWKAHQKIVGDTVATVQVHHNGLGNYAKLVDAYGEYTGDFPVYGYNRYANICKTIRSGTAVFTYPNFWYLYHSDQTFKDKVDALGLHDEAPIYAFKVMALADYLDTMIGDKLLVPALSDNAMNAEIAKARSAIDTLLAYNDMPEWFRNRELPKERRAVKRERTIAKHLYQYQDWKDLKRGLGADKLVAVADRPDIGLDCDDGMGKLAGVNQTYYQNINPQLWRLNCTLATAWRKEGGGTIHMTSAIRTLAYQSLMGNNSCGHTTGLACDLVLERGIPVWRWEQGEKFILFLRAHAREWGYDFYTEAGKGSDTGRNHIHLFITKPQPPRFGLIPNGWFFILTNIRAYVIRLLVRILILEGMHHENG